MKIKSIMQWTKWAQYTVFFFFILWASGSFGAQTLRDNQGNLLILDNSECVDQMTINHLSNKRMPIPMFKEARFYGLGTGVIEGCWMPMSSGVYIMFSNGKYTRDLLPFEEFISIGGDVI